MNIDGIDNLVSELAQAVRSAMDGDASAVDRLRDIAECRLKVDSGDSLGVLADSVAKLILLHRKNAQFACNNLEDAASQGGDLASLYEVAHAITSRLDFEELVLLLEEKTNAFLDADVCVIAVKDESFGGMKVIGPGLQMIRRNQIPDHLDKCEHAALMAASVGRPQFLSNIPNTRKCRFSRIAASEGVHHALSVPMHTQDGLVGAISVFRLNKHPFDYEDERRLSIIAGAAAVALENAEAYRREREIAEKLQNAILSKRTFSMPGFDVGCDYLSAGTLSKVGGDFYDIVDRGDGTFGIVMADISGKGLDAAVHTAMVRFTLRGLMLADPDPRRVLNRLNLAVRPVFPDHVFVTVFYGVLDTRSRVLVYANAGHDQPFMVNSSGCVDFDVTGRAIGALADYYESHQVSFSDGDILVLFTDGITEARRDGEFFGRERLCKIVFEKRMSDVDEIVRGVFSELKDFMGSVPTDDAGLLLIRANFGQTD